MVPDPNNPQSLNRYSYALNNPLRYTDPSGNVEWDVEWYDLGEVGSDYGTWGSFGNLNFNPSSPITSSSSNYAYGNSTLNINIPNFSFNSFSNTTYALNTPHLDFGNSNFGFNDFSLGSNVGAYGGL